MIAATEPRWRAVCRTLSLPVEDQPALGQALIVLKGEINTLQQQAFALSADTSDLPPDAMLYARPFLRTMLRRVCALPLPIAPPIRLMNTPIRHTLNHSELQHGRGQSSHTSRIAFERRIF